MFQKKVGALPLSHHDRGAARAGIAGDHKDEGDALGRAAHRRAPDRRDFARTRRNARNSLDDPELQDLLAYLHTL